MARGQGVFGRAQGALGGAIGHFRCPVHNSISPLSPELFKVLAVEMCQEAGAELLFNCELTEVKME